MPGTPILERTIALSLGCGVGGRDSREGDNLNGLDSRDEHWHTVKVKDDLNVTRCRKLLTVSFNRPKKTCAGTLLTDADESQELVREGLGIPIRIYANTPRWHVHANARQLRERRFNGSNRCHFVLPKE